LLPIGQQQRAGHHVFGHGGDNRVGV